MDVALIPPLCKLSSNVGMRMQMMLPSNLKWHKYETHYRYLSEWDDSYVIMDNGMFEEDKPRSHEEIIKMAIDYKVNEIVIPDARADFKTSLTLMQQFLDTSGPDLNSFNLMAVLQGETQEELVTCFEAYEFELQDQIDDGKVVFGLPRRLGEAMTYDARVQIVDTILGHHPDNKNIKFHFLGLNRMWLNDFATSLRYHRGAVRSIDSSAPFVWAFYGAELRYSRKQVFEVPPDYMIADVNMYNATLVNRNIDTLKVWANGGE